MYALFYLLVVLPFVADQHLPVLVSPLFVRLFAVLLGLLCPAFVRTMRQPGEDGASLLHSSLVFFSASPQQGSTSSFMFPNSATFGEQKKNMYLVVYVSFMSVWSGQELAGSRVDYLGFRKISDELQPRAVLVAMFDLASQQSGVNIV